MRHISTRISDEEFKLFEKNVNESGLNKSQYLRKLISEDTGIKSKILIDDNNTKSEGILDKLKKAFGVTEDILPVENPKPVTTHKRVRGSYKPTAKWIPKKTYMGNFKGRLESNHDKIKVCFSKGKGGSVNLAINCHEVLLLNEVYDKQGYFLNKDISDFSKLFDVSEVTLKMNMGRLTAGHFTEWISEFKEKFSYLNFEVHDYPIKGNSLIYINGHESGVSVGMARDIIGIISNNGFSETQVYKLVNFYSNIDSLEIRSICENYNNSNLLNLIKVNETNFVENDPSKRRNLIRIGGGNLTHLE